MSGLVGVISALACLLLVLLFMVQMTSIRSRLLPKFNPMISQLHLSPAMAHINSAWNSLFGHSESDQIRSSEGLSSKIRRYDQKLKRGSGGSEGEEEEKEATECAVCLCKIEQGDEIRELRCEHLFHSVCLERWVGYRHRTCPLCRGSLSLHNKRANYELVEEEDREVLFFNFASLSSRDRSKWWLR